ncbi:polysaccharide biosynthesis C-terminal domain-containing protein [Legionella jordanis]|uniref:Capsular polysaccharide assembling protein CapF C-terminal domain-containing protein n=1 Tax=Legionella jordanis TaxID=456 RepID=A0A0W0VBY5_9GAMM|nr:hypothetical protein [Legionella jordanis]KTD17619.1 hypothetical protein Ljor_1925 [Legionella jordanis]RMX00900.1 hypothetical protein EAW55_12050 [Legionella jordanis]VEH11459.1 Uncharacterised protein [Legionella jordanis]
MSDLVTIKQFNIIGQDERGLTAECFLSRKQDKFVYISRKAGTVSGNTYHQGKSEGTHPKIFVVLSGRIKFSYRKIGTAHVSSIEIAAPAQIEVLPYVTHKVEALEHCVILECNSLSDIKEDRIREEV